MKAASIFLFLLSLFLSTSIANSFHENYLFNAKDDSSLTKYNLMHRKYYTEQITTEPPKIDGILNDESWKQGNWSGNYLQFMPKEGATPTKKTELKILYDSDNMYVAIRAYDDPDKIDKQLGRRDDFTGDIVGVCFDSYFDKRTGFEFDLTAAGGKIDLILMNDGWDTNWDPVWEGKVGMEDSAWVAEMRIPLSQLRFGTKEEHIWGLHAWRWINRNKEEDQWNLMPRDNPGLMRSIGEIHGISGIGKSRRFELLPYTVGKIKTYEKEVGNPFADGRDANMTLGIDGKFGISSNFTVDFTINPDFGQVEADPSVLNLSAYETFYEEKRPFFLEGKNILDFDLGHDLLFYSRRIGHEPSYSPDLDDDEFYKRPENTRIIGAAKLSGKTSNGLSVGIVESVTAKEIVDIKTQDKEYKQTAEPLTNYLIGRVQKDIKQGNTIIGGMITSTNRSLNSDYLNFLNREAYTGGLDFRHFWKNKTYYIDAKTVFSHIKGHEDAILNLQESSSRYFQNPSVSHKTLDSTRNVLSGQGGSIEIGKDSNGNWRFSSGVSWKSPGLELNDVGYMRNADNVQLENEIGYVQDEPSNFFREYALFFENENNWDFGGTYLNSEYEVNFHSTLANKWDFSARTTRHGDIYDNTILRGGPGINLQGFWCNNIFVSSDNSKKISFDLSYHFHRYDDKLSEINGIFTGINVKITNTLILNTDVSYSVNRDNFQYVDVVDFNNKKSYLLGRLDQKTLGLTVRVDYSITPELTIQYYGNPYFSNGIYSRFKNITNPESKEYSEMYSLFEGNYIELNEVDNTYSFDETKDNIFDYTLDNPDFNFREFRSNLVARWEYKPGSTIYLVWTHGRSEYENITNNSINDNVNGLFDIFPNNVFLIKFNYWYSL